MKQKPFTYELHGTEISDPYHWLEDHDSPETRRWIDSQNERTFKFLEEIPERDGIRRRVTELWNYQRCGVPFKEGHRYFFLKNDGLQNQSVLYVRDERDAESRVLLDPNLLSPDGTVALTGAQVSRDGRLLAYGLSRAGSDWEEWHVRDVDTAVDLPDRLNWVKFSTASWTPDSKGFFYSRYDEPKAADQYEGQNYFQKLYYHRIGAAQNEDELIYHRPDQKEWNFAGLVSDDGRYLVLHVWSASNYNLLFYRDLRPNVGGPSDSPVKEAGEAGVPTVGRTVGPTLENNVGDATLEGGPVVELISSFHARYQFIGNDGPVFWLHTDGGAPRGKVISIDTSQSDRGNRSDVIPESDHTLEHAAAIGDFLVAVYLSDAHARVKVFDQRGGFVRDVELPGIGTVTGFTGRSDSAETFFDFTSFTAPPSVFRYDVATGQETLFHRPPLLFDPTQFETKQVFCPSKDGTRVPMFITHKQGLTLDGSHPTELYGYGGFNVSLTPAFSVSRIAWMEMGGVLAVANLRGGGEYGESWHLAGAKASKQNVFDDFIAGAEWLIDNGYTSRRKLAITGRSNGGLLVGACITQRPDLFGAAVPGVGVMDMLRFHKFTIGWSWVSDYGSPDDPEDFKVLAAYSPYHNIRPGVHYPPTLITTADHDDRVVPAHSYKFAAALQDAQAGPAPILIRIDVQAGHGLGKPVSKQIEEVVDVLSFLVRVLEGKSGQ